LDGSPDDDVLQGGDGADQLINDGILFEEALYDECAVPPVTLKGAKNTITGPACVFEKVARSNLLTVGFCSPVRRSRRLIRCSRSPISSAGSCFEP
jgi:hypothetical protein